MYKWIGALLVFSSVVMCGTYPIYCKSCRIRLLMELIDALEKMKVELHSNAPTLPRLMESVVLCANGKAKHFFSSSLICPLSLKSQSRINNFLPPLDCA
jgi:hypothetical protein